MATCFQRVQTQRLAIRMNSANALLWFEMNDNDLIELYNKGYVKLRGVIAKPNADLIYDHIWQWLSELHGIQRNQPDTWKDEWTGLKQ